ncbi:hypothetical protein JVT61DRAFT_10716 [Boletus reticuloceps]|uniref:Uncharacterized protein n=1 Tax=Boletus reticuloceps TaxID=495285 RepID=A0A8I2YFE4_9AGAM|nr:hypothetical protein JVT61DRAFT_10716 [Boletus reticuloceps]
MQTQEDSSSVPENIDLGACNKFTIPNIVALYSSPFAQGYSDQQRQAAIRAVLRHGAHTDRAHYHTKTPNGLHPGYAAFTTVEKSVDAQTFRKRELIEASLNDLFDTVTMQDRLDGGISVLLRCPGFQSHIPLTADQITVDAYVTPRELIRNEHVSGDMAVLVQAFCEEFAMLHTYSNPLISRLQCTGVLDTSKYSAANGTRHLSASAAIRASASVASSANTVPPAPKTQTPVPANPKTLTVPSAKKVQSDISSPLTLRQQSTRQRYPAEAFLYGKFPEPIPLVLPTETEPKNLVLISIGPNTDAILDRFNLRDKVLPTLHSLVTRVRSSRWEVALRSSPWNLTYEQATNLAGALAADLKGNVTSVTPVSSYLDLTSNLRISSTKPLPVEAKSFTSAKRHVQPPSRHSVEVVLTKEARATLRVGRHEKSNRFQAALDSAWHKVDKITQMLASTHRKSTRRVRNKLHFGFGRHLSRHKKINPWNAYCWKKARDLSILPAFVKQNLPEYHTLTADEKEQLIKEYSEHVIDRKVGVRTTTHGKITDVTQTLNAIEEELLNLRACTGVEAILYATHGSTDLPLHAVTFETEGVKEFIGTVIHMDTLDFISKMEGFAVQGVRGAASNHRQRISNVRGSIRKLINEKLCDLPGEITGSAKAKMQWTAYFRNIVSHYRVVIEGWLSTVPLANLSEALSSLPQLEMLEHKWEMGLTHWKKLSPEQFEALKRERDEKIESGEIVEPTRHTHSDKDTKRSHTGGANSSSRQSKKARSTPIVHEEEN